MADDQIQTSQTPGPDSQSTNNSALPERRFTGGYIDVPTNVTVNYGYSKFIRFFRKFIVLIALAFIAAVVIWMKIYNQQQSIPSTADNTTAPSGEAALISAQFDGIDNENRPYRVTADKAVRSTDDTDLINMTNPMADLLTADDRWLAGTAQSGEYNQAKSTLDLRDNVKLYYDDGVEFTLQNALLDLKQTSAISDMPVRGQGPSGNISAQALNITDGGNMIIFKGPATLQLRSAQGTGE